MSLFERFLTLWVALCIVAGLALGSLLPGVFAILAGLEYASVNLIVAVLIWAMVYPMMVAVDLGSLKSVGQRPKGLVITVVINWLIKPFTMAALGVLFFQHLFAGLIDGDKASEYIAGLILLGAAPCTAMVFVWSQMTKGDPNYTLVQVSLNDLIMVVAFAPIVAFLLGVTDIAVPWETLKARKSTRQSFGRLQSAHPLCLARPFCLSVWADSSRHPSHRGRLRGRHHSPPDQTCSPGH